MEPPHFPLPCDYHKQWKEKTADGGEMATVELLKVRGSSSSSSKRRRDGGDAVSDDGGVVVLRDYQWEVSLGPPPPSSSLPGHHEDLPLLQ